MEFFHWVTVYHGVMSNMYGEDREEALEVMDDDQKFDRWMKKYEEKRKRGVSNKPVPAMTKEEYLERFGGYHGGDDG